MVGRRVLVVLCLVSVDDLAFALVINGDGKTAVLFDQLFGLVNT